MYHLATIDQPIDDGEKCYTFEELSVQNKRNDQQALKNCALLNRAEPYFNMFPVKPTRSGQMKVMSSRNNNFSNRGQKMTLVVIPPEPQFTINNKDQDTTNSNSYRGLSGGEIIGIIFGGFAAVLLVTAIVKRDSIAKSFKKTRVSFHQNTASYI